MANRDNIYRIVITNLETGETEVDQCTDLLTCYINEGSRVRRVSLAQYVSIVDLVSILGAQEATKQDWIADDPQLELLLQIETAHHKMPNK
jgi:hypothetical protein